MYIDKQESESAVTEKGELLLHSLIPLNGSESFSEIAMQFFGH